MGISRVGVISKNQDVPVTLGMKEHTCTKHSQYQA